MADKPEDRKTDTKPMHEAIIGGLVRIMQSEIGHKVVLTLQDDENYDAFKADPDNRKGPWCTLRPRGFDLEARGQGLTTAVRPNAFLGAGAHSLQPSHSSVGRYTVTQSERGLGENGLVFSEWTNDLVLVLHKSSWQPAENDVLTIRSGAGTSVLTVREELADSAMGNKRYIVELDADQSLPVEKHAAAVTVYVRRASRTAVNLVPAMIDFAFRYATTDTWELLDFFATWAFMRARNRLNFAVRYLGKVVPIHVALGPNMEISDKQMPGEEGAYHVYEGQLQVSGAFSHDDSRDTRIEPMVVDVDLGLGFDSSVNPDDVRTVGVG